MTVSDACGICDPSPQSIVIPLPSPLSPLPSAHSNSYDSPLLIMIPLTNSLQTWWTVEARAPDPSPSIDPTQQRALAILTKIAGMHLGAAWKSLQLGVLTIWNVCSRSANMER